MNFIELLEKLKIDKSSIQDFDKWASYLKDIKGHSKNTYRSYCCLLYTSDAADE